MRIFAIKDNNREYGYLFYYKDPNTYYIEICNNLNKWTAPFIFDTYVSNNKHVINSYWSKLWVTNRVIPSERQNIQEILLNSKLKDYDEFKLLLLSKGKCVQDDLFIEEKTLEELPIYIKKRRNMLIHNVVPIKNNNLLVFFYDKTTKIISINDLIKDKEKYNILWNDESFFNKVSLEPDGCGINWGNNIIFTYEELSNIGKRIPIYEEDFIEFINHTLISTKEASQLLKCSRQNISDLISRNKIKPIKQTDKISLFLKNEILKRCW